MSRRGLGVLLSLTLCAAGAAQAQTLPRWELGIGLGVLSLPYYRGADNGRRYLLPFPYIVYRGEHVRVDDEGIRGFLFRSERARLDFSLAAGVPVPSDRDSIRHDMPRLDPTVEFGPSMEVRLWRHPEQHRSLWLKLPVRAAFSVAWGKVAHQGWIFAPFLEYHTRRGNADAPWLLNVSAGPEFADRAYHDYFYEVPSNYATATRAEYHPGPGYSGSRVTLALQKRWGDVSLGAFIRYDNLQGAVFTDSPLVQRRDYVALGVAVIKLLAVSKESEEKP
jgi:outer membrane scaffolding protein for murein synthesis (MipA/OmpV family)